MSSYNPQGSPFLKIVYAKVKSNGTVALLPLELYADGSLQRGSQ
jgi:hypothetical protein